MDPSTKTDGSPIWKQNDPQVPQDPLHRTFSAPNEVSAGLRTRSTKSIRPVLKHHNYFTEMRKESWKIMLVALPSVVTQINLYTLFPLAASAVGRRLTSEELAGISLGALLGNLTCLSVIMGAMSAVDTLLPRAFAARQYSDMGVLVVRSLLICAALLILPVLVLSQPHWTWRILVSWGTDDVVAIMAAHWMRVYIVGVPGTTLFRAIQRFCISQKHPWPPVQASVLITFFFHPVLLNQWVERYGLLGSAWAVVTSQYSMLAVLVCIVYRMKQDDKAFHEQAWPQLSSCKFWNTVVQTQPMWEFFSLSLGGVVSMSEWWFGEVVSFLVGRFGGGVVPFCAHSISYHLVPFIFMAPYGLGVGLTVRIGTLLASPSVSQSHHEDSARRAQIISATTLGLAALIGLVEAVVLYVWQGAVIALFTIDPYVVHKAESIWFFVCLYIFILHVFAIQDAILRGLDLQWRTGVVLLVILWCVGLPIITYCIITYKIDLRGMWQLLVLIYAIIQVGLCGSYIVGIDWRRAGTPMSGLDNVGLTDGTAALDDRGFSFSFGVMSTDSVERNLLLVSRTASPTFGRTIPVNMLFLADSEENDDECFVVDEFRHIV